MHSISVDTLIHVRMHVCHDSFSCDMTYSRIHSESKNTFRVEEHMQSRERALGIALAKGKRIAPANRKWIQVPINRNKANNKFLPQDSLKIAN